MKKSLSRSALGEGRFERLRSLLAIVLAATPLASLACGVCIEDKVAVTYDHAVVSRAAERHQLVVFAAIEGRGDPAAQAESAKRAAGRVRGIDRASVRAAASPQALSFALDPKATDPASALAAIEQGAHGLSLTLLRVVK